MQAAHEKKSNPLSSRDEVVSALTAMLDALDKQFRPVRRNSPSVPPAPTTAMKLLRWRGSPARCGGCSR